MNSISQKNIVIWGAGRIGRGFAGDIFASAGYHLTFVDQAQPLIELLEQQKSYTVVRAVHADDISRLKITDYESYHVSQTKEVKNAILQTDLVAVAVFPKDFETVAVILAEQIVQRRAEKPDTAINIILCTNLVHAGPIFQKHLYQNLNQEQQDYFSKYVGVVESLVIRMAPNAPEHEVEKDPLVVWTNGFMEFPVAQASFRGSIPEMPYFRLVQDMRSEEIRKMYTYNMCHAFLAYHGHQKQYQLLVECLADSAIRTEVDGALNEVSQALQLEYGFTEAEMKLWIDTVIDHTNNPSIGDTVARMAADPFRKLRRTDRLIGPALLCLKNGINPVHLIKAIGLAFHYQTESDPASLQMANLVEAKGVKATIHEICGLGDNPQDKKLADEIELSYQKSALEILWRQKAQQAYELGFKYEKIYHGCGQCVYAATTEVLEKFSPDVFNAATGLCGGIGLKNDGTCSAFTGGVLAIGLIYNRRRDHFDGDREGKYKNFELVQQLREKFISEFGGLTCACVHEHKYGRSYDLSQKEERDAFEEAGGHGDVGCTQTVGKAAQFVIEVLTPGLIAETKE